ncbi:MAG: segregation and condensation protein A [Pikeienuella sp.]
MRRDVPWGADTGRAQAEQGLASPALARHSDGVEAGPGGLTVDVDGFEGPLDLLLDLARRQKVDLRRVSIRDLAEQYLDFIAGAKALRISVAADYLVMASWLAYLKSRLMLPPEPGEPEAEELAADLALRLERLDAMRRAAAALMARDRLGVQRLPRGAPEGLTIARRVTWQAGLTDLLRAYGRLRTRDAYRPLPLDRPPLVTIEAAAARISGGLPEGEGWHALETQLPSAWVTGRLRASGLASGFAAALELARQGRVELRQDASFAPLLLRWAGQGARMAAE